jgi:hypothetical protein
VTDNHGGIWRSGSHHRKDKTKLEACTEKTHATEQACQEIITSETKTSLKELRATD